MPNFWAKHRILRTFLWYYFQAGVAVTLLVISNEVSNPTRYPPLVIGFTESGFFGTLAVVFAGIYFGIEDYLKMREWLGRYAKFLVLTLGWLIGLFNQVTGTIITNLASLAGVPVLLFQALDIWIIGILLALVAGAIWALDKSKSFVEGGRRGSSVLDYNPDLEKRVRFRRFLARHLRFWN